MAHKDRVKKLQSYAVTFVCGMWLAGALVGIKMAQAIDRDRGDPR